MKKIFLIVITIINLFLFCSFININAKSADLSFLNKNGIYISNEMFEKLIKVGYTEKEIENIGSEEYLKISNMKIKDSSKQDIYIKTISYKENDQTKTVDKVISKNTAFKEVNEINNIKKKAIKNSNSNTILKVKPDIEFEDGSDLPIGPTDPDVQASVTTEYKHLLVTGTFYESQGSLGTFFIKVNLTWLITPSNRYYDVISINIADNVQITSKNVDGYQYPNFYSHFTYDKEYNYDLSFHNPNLISNQKKVLYSDINDYEYILDEGIAVKYKLPKNTYKQVTKKQYNELYSNFFFTLSADFIPKSTGLNATSFLGNYVHEINYLDINLDSISLTLTPPYFSVNLGAGAGTTFDTIAKPIFFENLQ